MGGRSTEGRGRRVVLIGASPLAAGIAEGLRERGDDIVTLAPETEDGVGCELDSEDAVREALGLATERLGGIDQLLHAWVPPSLLRETSFTDIEEVGWIDGCERALEAAWWVARQAIPPLLATGGSMVFLVPTVGLAGGAGFTMLGAYAEGVRVLAKGCGRQLGTQGVTVNTIATAPHLWVGTETGDALTRSISLSTPAFGRTGSPTEDLAPLVAMLASPDAAFLTAGTLTADGGIWMGL